MLCLAIGFNKTFVDKDGLVFIKDVQMHNTYERGQLGCHIFKGPSDPQKPPTNYHLLHKMHLNRMSIRSFPLSALFAIHISYP